jgi:branched-chain amino acid transport system substrate-binding protein
MTSTKTFRGVVVAAVLALGLSACGSSDSDAGGTAQDDTVKLGMIGPKSGPASDYWKEQMRGYELGAAAVAEDFGYKFDVVEADDGGEPEKAATEIQKLLNEDNVDVIFGPPTSGSALQIAPIIQKVGRPWLISNAASDEILDTDQDTNWGFRFQNTVLQAITANASLLFESGSKPAIVYSADAYGQQNEALMKQYAEDNGDTLVASEGLQPGSQDFSTVARRLQDSGADHIYLAVTAGADSATLTKAFQQIGYDPKIIASTTILAGYTPLATPEQWSNLVFADARDPENPAYKKLLADYKAKYGEDPVFPTTMSSSYLAIYAYAEALKAEGDDPSDYGAVRDALESLPELDARGWVFDQPFSADDHELYTADPDAWTVEQFDANGKIVAVKGQ